MVSRPPCRHLPVLAALALVAASAPAGADSLRPSYTLTDLGHIYPFGISNAGDVIARGPGGPFLWRDGTTTGVAPADGTRSYSQAVISPGGTVAYSWTSFTPDGQ